MTKCGIIKERKIKRELYEIPHLTHSLFIHLLSALDFGYPTVFNINSQKWSNFEMSLQKIHHAVSFVDAFIFIIPAIVVNICLVPSTSMKTYSKNSKFIEIEATKNTQQYICKTLWLNAKILMFSIHSDCVCGAKIWFI